MHYTHQNFKIFIQDNTDGMSKKAATIFSREVHNNPALCYGFATGSTPIQMYKELIKMHENKELDFSQMTTFNLDEYYPMPKESEHSYHYFMMENLFNHVNINKNNINLPDGMAEDTETSCAMYDKKIKTCGGIQMQILGIGTNGHIGFNEPADFFGGLTSKTKLVESTIKSNSRNFENIADVPTEAITMGIRSIMMANNILILANGENKAEAIYNMIFGKIEPKNPASALQLHRHVDVVVDKEAAKLVMEKLG